MLTVISTRAIARSVKRTLPTCTHQTRRYYFAFTQLSGGPARTPPRAAALKMIRHVVRVVSRSDAVGS